MLKTYTIPLSNISINSLYDLWINNGFDDESNVDIHKDLLLGSEKNINCIEKLQTCSYFVKNLSLLVNTLKMPAKT